MCFDELMTDTVSIIKGGKKYGPFKAAVNKCIIELPGNLIVVDRGDKVIRYLSNGGKETYIVTDPCYNEKFGPIGAHYRLHLRKGESLPPTRPKVGNVTIRGNNNRLNINSNDNSINVTRDDQVQSQIDKLREAIKAGDMSEDERAEFLDTVEEIKEKSRSAKPNRKLLKGLLDSLPQTDNILSIASSIMSFFG